MFTTNFKRFSQVLILGYLVQFHSLAADTRLPAATAVAENINKRPSLSVTCPDNLVNAHIINGSVGQVLQLLRSKCGLQSNITDPEITTSRIRIKLNRVSVEDALRAILEGYSYVIYPIDDKLSVSLLSTTPPLSPSSSESNPASSARKSAPTEDDSRPPYDSTYPSELTDTEDTSEYEPSEDEPESLDEFQVIEAEQTKDERFDSNEDAQFHDPQSETELLQHSTELLIDRAQAAIESDYNHLKQEAINQLASLEDPKAVEILISSANGDLNIDNDSRVEAVMALWRSATESQFQNIDSVNTLKQLVSDPDNRVSEIAKQAVENMSSTSH